MEDTVFWWKETEKGEACIQGGYGASSFVVVPGSIEGCPVTAIGDYCFSDSAKKERQEVDHSFLRELSGDYIQKVVLPDSVKKLGDLAFYNCSSLKELQIGASLTELGSDAFMNCLQLDTIRVRCRVSEKTGLKQLLAQRTSDTEVIFETEAGVEGILLFPEYYQGYDEVGPAHIFALQLSGEGFRARQCFQDGVLDLDQYDRIFEQAAVEESPRTLCRMAVDRLCYPVGLKSQARERYQNYLRGQEGLLLTELVKNRDLERMERLFRGKHLTESGQEKGIRLASDYNWPEGAASLLRWKMETEDRKKKDRYSFDDF